jgi:hypothetical protein
MFDNLRNLFNRSRSADQCVDIITQSIDPNLIPLIQSLAKLQLPDQYRPNAENCSVISAQSTQEQEALNSLLGSNAQRAFTSPDQDSPIVVSSSRSNLDTHLPDAVRKYLFSIHENSGNFDHIGSVYIEILRTMNAAINSIIQCSFYTAPDKNLSNITNTITPLCIYPPAPILEGQSIKVPLKSDNEQSNTKSTTINSFKQVNGLYSWFEVK